MTPAIQTMTENHPITPPPKLVEQWHSNSPLDRGLTIATRAAQWGADQELEACCEWLDREGWSGESRQLRAARRPKPPSLKEQALEALDRVWNGGSTHTDWELFRRALEALPE
jgi:hypothetical protein